MVVTTLKAIGWPDKRIAAILGITERSVRRNLDMAKARIAEGTRIEPDRDALIAWWWCHTSCCMAGALHALEAGKLLDSA